MKILMSVILTLLVAGSVMAGSIPATDAGDERPSSRSTRERRTESVSNLGVRVSVAGLNGPYADVLRSAIGGALSDSGYEVIDLYPEEDYNSSGSWSNGGSDAFVRDMVVGAMGTGGMNTNQQSRSSNSRQNQSRRTAQADYILSGNFATQGLIRKSAAVRNARGQEISLEGLIALKVRQTRTNRLFNPKKPIRESYSQWVGIGGNSNFVVGSGRSSDLKFYDEVYQRIATKIVVAVDEAVQRSSSSNSSRPRRR